MARNFDWQKIRTMRLAGHTSYAISKLPGMPSKQAIMKHEKAEDWGNQTGNPQLPQLPNLPPALLGKDTPESRARFVALVAQGVPQRHAAAAIGFSDRTTRGWKDNDAAFAAQVAAARSAHLIGHVGNINDHSKRDWKASAWVLERADSEFRPRFNPGAAIMINLGGFNRDSIKLPTIPSEPAIDAELIAPGDDMDNNR